MCLAASCAFTAKAQDVLPPQLLSASITPASVDATGGAQTITVTVEIADAGEGFLLGFLDLVAVTTGNRIGYGTFFDGANRTAGDASSGTYEVSITVPAFGPPGTWRVDAWLLDVEDNSQSYSPDTVPPPVPEDLEFEVVNNGDVDGTPPTLVAVDFPTDPLALEGPGQYLPFTVEVEDDLSGLLYGSVFAIDPDGNPEFNISSVFDAAQRTGGDANNGTYGFELWLPGDMAPGTWGFVMSLFDVMGNYAGDSIGTLTILSASAPEQAGFLAQAVDAVQLTFASTGRGWVLQSGETADGWDAATSRPAGDGEEAGMQTTITGPGTLSFAWRVDSEADQDTLSVLLDGTPQETISGDTGWNTTSVEIPAGSHTIEWRYAKDGSGSSGEDRGWVDRVRFQTPEDEALPVLQDFRMGSRVVDLREAPQYVPVRIEVTDDFHGLEAGTLRLFDASDALVVERAFDVFDSANSDPLDDVYEFFVEIPDTAEHGLWRAEIELTEAVTSATRTYGQGNSPFPVRRSEIFYAGDPEATDNEAPEVQAIEFTPGSVDVTDGSSSITMTIQVTDSPAGLNYLRVEVLNAEGSSTGAMEFDQFLLVDGDEFNGIYQVEIPAPEFGTPGTWSVVCEMWDFNGNHRNHPNGEPYPPDVSDVFTVTNNGPIDQGEPVVPFLSVAPDVIDTTSGPADITVTVTLEDDLSGIREAYLYFYDPADQFQSALLSRIDSAPPVSTDGPLSKTYQVVTTLPQGSATGQWRVSIYLADRVGNIAIYGAGQTAFPGPDDGSFMVQESTPSLFQAAMAGYGLSGDEALPGSDADKDGRINALEVILGTHPGTATNPGDGLIRWVRDGTHLHLDFTVDPSLTVTPQASYLEVSDGGAGTPLRVTGQTQPGLAGTWTHLVPTNTSGTTYRISTPLDSGNRSFLRLQFVDP